MSLSGIADANGELLQDVGGQILKLAMAVQANLLLKENEDKLYAYEQLIKSLSDQAYLYLLIDESEKLKVEAWLSLFRKHCRVHLVLGKDDSVSATTAWIRDPFLCSVSNGELSILKTASAKTERYVPLLASTIGAKYLRKLIALDGGDCLVLKDHWIVGVNAVNNTSEIIGHRCDYYTALRRIAALHLQFPIVAGYRLSDIKNKLRWFLYELRAFRPSANLNLISNNEMPSPQGIHIGVFARISQILSKLLKPYDLIQDWEHIDLVISVTGMQNNGKDILLVASSTMHFETTDKRILAEGDRLDALAIHMERQGFEVIRNPSSSSIDGRTLWYNNTIIQNDPNIVWLPQFAGPGETLSSDGENIRIWECLGFSVIPVSGWDAFLASDGAIRCATKPLARLQSNFAKAILE